MTNTYYVKTKFKMQRKLIIILLLLPLSFILYRCSDLQSDHDKSGLRVLTTKSQNTDSTLYLVPQNFFLVSYNFKIKSKPGRSAESIELIKKNYLPGFAYIDSLRGSGIPIVGGVFAVHSGCTFIIQADNNTTLHNYLRNCPLNDVSDVEIKPLVSIGQYLLELKKATSFADSINTIKNKK